MYGKYLGQNLPLQMGGQGQAPQPMAPGTGNMSDPMAMQPLLPGQPGEMPQGGMTSLPPGVQGITPSQAPNNMSQKAKDMLAAQLMQPRQVDNSQLDLQALAPFGLALAGKYMGG